MKNLPGVKIGLIAVSRDCFPAELSRRRRKALAAECQKLNLPLAELETIIENENDVLKALEEIKDKEINSLVIFLGNFGPEGPTTILAQRFKGPVMVAAAAEETSADLYDGRGDAYCGLLNTSYNAGLRQLKIHIPEYPVGTAAEVARMIEEFVPVARAWLGLKNLKIFSFGPRPQDFYACNAPIKPLFDLGVEVMENSELDLYEIFLKADGSPEIKAVAADMARELGAGNTYPELLNKLAQYEVALLNFLEKNLGASRYGVFANKCWPAFEPYFGFVPCYVNSRLATRGIPVACEVDIYGALSEYLLTCATELPATLLDINNTVPADMYEKNRQKIGDYKPTDLFMGFHCGNTASCCLLNPAIKYQLIMHRLMEPGKEPEITRGTLEGRMKPGQITIFRLQGTAETELCSYLAQGEVLDVEPQSFGSIGVFGIREMGRFYRHVLIEQKFPHHTAVGFKPAGQTLFVLLRMLGVKKIYYNQPPGLPYPTENPF
ncbi:MAG: L-fucose/L-arabinose isomerase family protein [Candidatus Saccharicenans sp.]|uniref:L-fucose/L-arabinose isomerase family protein n=1 Tax=Candidatus Saccharicenans sp. TaxID=2819258 RepID=UPI00404AE205